MSDKTLSKCPYGDCTFEGSEAALDDHITYMTSTMLNDSDHAPDKLNDRR